MVTLFLVFLSLVFSQQSKADVDQLPLASEDVYSEASYLPFELPWMNHPEAGKIYRSSDYPGSVFVFETYFLQCPYCNQNAVNVENLATAFAGDDRVQVLDLGRDTRGSDYDQWIARHNPRHPVLKDASRVLLNKFGTRLFPTTYVLNCRGELALMNEGLWSPGYKDQLVSQIRTLLKDSACRTSGQ